MLIGFNLCLLATFCLVLLPTSHLLRSFHLLPSSSHILLLSSKFFCFLLTCFFCLVLTFCLLVLPTSHLVEMGRATLTLLSALLSWGRSWMSATQLICISQSPEWARPDYFTFVNSETWTKIENPHQSKIISLLSRCCWSYPQVDSSLLVHFVSDLWCFHQTCHFCQLCRPW